MAENIEKARDIKGVKNCVLCGKKMGVGDKLHMNTYTHRLADGVPCPECDRKIMILLMYQKDWADAEVYKQALSRRYDWRSEYTMPVADAKTMLSLRDQLCDNFLQGIGAGEGGVFVVKESFQMPPSPPGIFILRARKIRNKMVVKGFSLKDTFKKGGKVLLQVNGELRETEILDAVPLGIGNGKFNKETFYSQLSSNVHDHTLSECEDGWLILDTEQKEECPAKGFLAGKL